MQHVTVQVTLGEGAFELRGREVESLVIKQELGKHVECTLTFDRDPRSAHPIAKVTPQDLADVDVRVVFVQSVGDAIADGFGGALGSTAKGALTAAVGAFVGHPTDSARGGIAATLGAVGGSVGGALGDAGQIGTAFLGGRVAAPAGPNTGNGAGAAGAPFEVRGATGPALADAAASASTGAARAAVGALISRPHQSGRGVRDAALGAVGGVLANQAGQLFDAAQHAVEGAAHFGSSLVGGASTALGAGALSELAFDGHVRKIKVTYQPSGTARFEVTAQSRSYELDAHADRRRYPKQTVLGLVEALGASVGEGVDAGSARDYERHDESAWAMLGRVAGTEGLQLRPVWARTPAESAPPKPAEVAKGFAEKTHTLTWGRDLTTFELVLTPTNHGVTSSFFEHETKHDHEYRGVRRNPQWLGGARPLVEAAERVAATDAGGGDPGRVAMGRAGGTQARDHGEYLPRLERESEARLGGAVEASGSSELAQLRAGDQIEVTGGSPGLFGVVSTWGSDVGADERKGIYGLKSVEHHWAGGLYSNKFTATPWENFHPGPAASGQPASTTSAAQAGAAHAAGAAGPTGAVAALPRAVPGLQTGEVMDVKDPKHLARVKVRIHGMRPEEATQWLPVLGLGGGNGRGLAHLASVGDTVLIAYIANDPEHPVVLGGLWNKVDQPGHGPGRSHWITKAGSTIALIDGDHAGKEVVEIHTPGGHAMVKLDAHGPVVTVYSDGDLSLEAPKGELRIDANSMKTHVKTNVKRDVGGNVDEKVAGKVTLEAGGQLGLKGGTVVVTSNGTLQAHAGGVLTITGHPVTTNP